MTSSLPFFLIDAFTDTPFRGNPAGVVPLLDHDSWPDPALMQSIASEINQAETAFVRAAHDLDDADYHLRWFTPTVEVPICGHATLASGFVLRHHLGVVQDRVTFACKAGWVSVDFDEHGRPALDFPSVPPARRDGGDAPPEILGALGAAPTEPIVYADLVGEATPICVYESEADLAALAPDVRTIEAIGDGVLIATAPAADDQTDFVSRFFAPGAGIDEDPVTGSAHCALVPYWAARLGKDGLVARQISKRTGLLRCTLQGDRVRLEGGCVTVINGELRGAAHRAEVAR